MNVTGESANIDPRDLNQLKYLDRVLKETLRLFPIAPILGRQIQGDIKLSYNKNLTLNLKFRILICRRRCGNSRRFRCHY